MPNTIEQIVQTFSQRGTEKYGAEAVSQLQHALQSGTLAIEEQADNELVIAALLHDIGHILGSRELPHACDDNLDDRHETIGYTFLKRHFGDRVADPVRLHVAAKRYLCTIDPDYEKKLSPTSHKSFLDQGGVMSDDEKREFENEPHFEEALLVRRWDDIAKDPNKQTPEIDDFVPRLREALLHD